MVQSIRKGLQHALNAALARTLPAQWDVMNAAGIPLLPQKLVIVFVVVLYDGQKDEAYHDRDK